MGIPDTRTYDFAEESFRSEIVSDGGEGHEAPPEGLDEGPGVVRPLHQLRSAILPRENGRKKVKKRMNRN